MSSEISSVSGGGGVAPSVLQIKTRHLIRPPTPETMMTDRPNDPDISIFCEKCHEFISVRATQEHRSFHNALTVLGYSGKEQPESVKGLLKKRQELMKDLNKKSNPRRPVSFDKLQKINEAFELVKAHLEETFEELVHSKENFVYDCKGISLNCSAPCVRAVGICSDDNSRWKSKMEDTRVFQDYYGNDVNKCFFGIYDGYNGRFAADIAANDLHHVFLSELQKVDEKVSCTCTVNLADKNDLTDYQLERGSPIVRSDSIRHILHEESVNIIQQIMHTCESNLIKMNDGDDSQEPESDRPMRKKKNRDPEFEKIALAYHKTYLYLDRYLSYGINETSLVRWSGCSALSLLIDSKEQVCEEVENHGNSEENTKKDDEVSEEKKDGKKEIAGKDEEEKGDAQEGQEKETKESEVSSLEELGVLHIANAGNTQAVLCRAGKAYRLSRDHTPGNPQEKTRTEKAGSSIHAGGPYGRVNGILDTTRGLGNYGDPHLKKAVIPDPYTTSVKIDQHAQFIVMASCGLWDVLTDNEVVSLVKQTLTIHQSRAEADNVPDGFGGYGTSDITTYGEDFLGESYATGLGTSYDPTGFDNTVTSVIDIDAAEGDDANAQKQQFKNPLQSLKEDADADDENDEDDETKSKSQITWNEPLTDGGAENQQKGPSHDRKSQMNGIRVKGVAEDTKAESDKETVSELKNYKDEFNDNASVKTDFESMLSALCEDGNEADIETLTELHTFYAKSRLSEGLGMVDKKEEYRLAAEMISERLVQSALMAGSRDNITVMVILLHGCKL